MDEVEFTEHSGESRDGEPDQTPNARDEVAETIQDADDGPKRHVRHRKTGRVEH